MNTKPCYIALKSAPRIPLDLVLNTAVGECTRKTPDLSYGHAHYLVDGTRLWPASYYINTFQSPELTAWIKDNIADQPEILSLDLGRITLQTQQPQANLTSSHIVHSDIAREWCLFYILKPGGANCITRWYQERDKPLLRAKADSSSQSDSGRVDYKDLTEIAQVQFQSQQWYILNISILHDVQGIEATRQSLRIYCEPKLE
jgi:hypothetical protein